MTLRVGLVGAGHVLAYAKAFQQIPDAQVTALCALPDDLRRKDAAAKYDIPNTYDSVNAMLDKQPLDAVVVGSPPRYHREHACAALEAGCAVLCEKPPAMNAQEASAMYFRCLALDTHLAFGLCLRYARGLPPPRSYLSSVHVRLRRTTLPATGWSQDVTQSGGGCLADIGCHALDAGLYALGDPVPVAASGKMYDGHGNEITSGCESSFVGVVEVADGKRISLDISWVAEKDEALLTCSGNAPSAPPHTGAVADVTPLVADDDLYLRCAQGFLKHIFTANRAKQLEITARGVILQRCLDALYLSCAKGHGIKLA